VIEYDFELICRYWGDYGRAYIQWSSKTQLPEKITVVLENLMKDVNSFDELVSGIDALYLCEIICINSSYWECGKLISQCIVKEAELGTCPVMDFMVEITKKNYKLNTESINIKNRWS
jgi:hypothetical protein